MIKNLLEADESDSAETKQINEGKETIEEAAIEDAHAPHFSETNDTENFLEIPDAPFEAPNDFQAISDETNQTTNDEVNFELPAAPKINEARTPSTGGTLFQTSADYNTNTAETIRQSGLAYSAAVTLFGSVVFMLIIGWGADLLFGTSPWGIVGGITLGAMLGFFQFFRITSQIFKK